MRLKYYNLTKEEKLKLREDFYKTNFGFEIKKRLIRLRITGIIGTIFSAFLYYDSEDKWGYVFATVLLLTSIFFIIASFKIMIKKLTLFLVSKKK